MISNNFAFQVYIMITNNFVIIQAYLDVTTFSILGWYWLFKFAQSGFIKIVKFMNFHDFQGVRVVRAIK